MQLALTHSHAPLLPRARATQVVPGWGSVWTAGEASLLARQSVAIIGSRSASHEGRAAAATLASSLARLDIVVVSGLAAGIDAAAHEAAMHAGGRTVAVIGTSLDTAYPRGHASLQARIAADHLVVSPFAAGTPTSAWHFPKRNRLMALLSSAVLLIEADEKSGTRHVIDECARLGKPVFVRSDLVDRLSWLRRAEGRTTVVPWNPAGGAQDSHERLSPSRYAVPFDALIAAVATATTSRAP